MHKVIEVVLPNDSIVLIDDNVVYSEDDVDFNPLCSSHWVAEDIANALGVKHETITITEAQVETFKDNWGYDDVIKWIKEQNESA